MRNDIRVQWYRDYILLLTAAVIFFADQVSKAIVLNRLFFGQSMPQEGFFRITRTLNTGTAFGLFQGHSEALTIISVFVIGILLWVIISHKYSSPIIRGCLGLLLGGAMGNLVDRLRLGHVTDFIDVGVWPVFNIADSAIVTGIIVLVGFSIQGYGLGNEKQLDSGSVLYADQYHQSLCSYCGDTVPLELEGQHRTTCISYSESPKHES